MSPASQLLGGSMSDHPLKSAFLKWQCRVRQLMMRDNQGRPDDAITPALILPGQDLPFGHIITILNKTAASSVTADLLHMYRKTNDPAARRDQALTYFSATYYQKHKEFSDILTATFRPGSDGAAKIRAAGTCALIFEAYGQTFTLHCKVWRLAPHNAHHAATMAHNQLFNPALPGDTVVLGFEPDWNGSSSARVGQ